MAYLINYRVLIRLSFKDQGEIPNINQFVKNLLKNKSKTLF